MRRLAAILCLGGLAACEPAKETQRGTLAELSALRSEGTVRFSADDVVTWAQLDDHFLDHKIPLEPSKADGRALLGRLVMLLNAEDAVEFTKAHGSSSVRGPVGVRKIGTHLEVDVELTGKDGQKLLLILKSDGKPASEG